MFSRWLIVAIVSLIFIIIAVKIYRFFKKIGQLRKIGSPRHTPFVGHLFSFLKPPHELLQHMNELCDAHPSITVFFISYFKPVVMLYGAGVVEEALKVRKLTNKSSDYDLLKPAMGEGLMTSNGLKWAQRRKLLTPAFHSKVLQDFTGIYNRKTKTMLSNLAKAMKEKEVVDMHHFVDYCYLDLVSETAVGIDMKIQQSGANEYINAIFRYNSVVHRRMTNPWLQSEMIFRLTPTFREQQKCLKVIHGTCMSIIREKRKIHKDSVNNRKDEKEKNLGIQDNKHLPFLDLLIQNTSLSDQDILEETETFLSSGYETASIAASMAIYLLGLDEAIQDKVYEELLRVTGPVDCPIKSEHIKDLTYLEMCIKESLRLFPSAYAFGKSTNEDVQLNGHSIPSRTSILIYVYKLHRDPKHFPDPERFDPDRFLPENISSRHPFAYIPFSAGQRNCIGQKFAMTSMKIVIGAVLKKFKVRSVDDRHQMKLAAQVLLKPHGGVRVKLQVRKDSNNNEEWVDSMKN